MIENVKSLLIAVTKEFGPEEASFAVSYGLSLARAAGAHATVEAGSIRLELTSPWVGRFAGGFAGAENKRLQALAEEVGRRAEAAAAAAGVDCTVKTQHLDYPGLLNVFRQEARVHDLAVVDTEREAMHFDRGVIEALVVDGGRPLIVVPTGLADFRCGSVIVAWDGSGKAARAAADALPFLRIAESVRIVSVTEPGKPGGGAGLKAYLARHGIEAELQPRTAENGDIAQALRDAAVDSSADLLVMGAYVHSRIRELIFGGVTQSLLKEHAVPLFMSS